MLLFTVFEFGLGKILRKKFGGGWGNPGGGWGGPSGGWGGPSGGWGGPGGGFVLFDSGSGSPGSGNDLGSGYGNYGSSGYGSYGNTDNVGKYTNYDGQGTRMGSSYTPGYGASESKGGKSAPLLFKGLFFG